MPRRAGVLLLVAVVSVLTVVTVCGYAFGGDPTEYCRTSSIPPPTVTVGEKLPRVEGHWTAFPIVGASCTWKVASDVHYVTSTVRWIPTLALCSGLIIAVVSIWRSVTTYFANRR